MPRTAITPTALPGEGGANMPAGTAVDPTNGHVVALQAKSHRCLIWVHNTVAATKVVTVKKGANPPAFGAVADLAYTAQASGDSILGPFSSAKYVQADGSLNIDLASGITGTIAVFTIPEV